MCLCGLCVCCCVCVVCLIMCVCLYRCLCVFGVGVYNVSGGVCVWSVSLYVSVVCVCGVVNGVY